MSSLERKASERKHKMKDIKEKQRKAAVAAEIKAKHSAIVAKVAAATEAKRLKELNAKLSAKKRGLKKDVWGLKLKGRVDKMGKAALLKFYTQLGQKQEKVRGDLSHLQKMYKMHKAVNRKSKALFERVNRSTSTVWLKLKTRSLSRKVHQLQHEILAEKQYGKTLPNIQALKDAQSGAALLKQLDQRKQAAVAGIARLKNELKSPAKKLALYRQLKDEEKALKGEGASSMRQRFHAQKAVLARGIVKAQVKKAKVVAAKKVKHDNKLAKYKEFVQKDSIKRASKEKLEKKLLWQDKRIATLTKQIAMLRSGKRRLAKAAAASGRQL